MCCFSQPVEAVNSTRIFARIKERSQFLVYQMRFSADRDLAMILPLPIKQTHKLEANEIPIRFIDLSGYQEFFEDLDLRFPQSRGSQAVAASAGIDRSWLKVYSVGSFNASFVPTINDFQRLDPQFCLPDRVWQQLPQYNNYGFAVFQLKSGNCKIHPMALKFAMRDNQVLFLPTFHIHDGNLESHAEFDHVLYIQSEFKLDSAWEKARYSVDKIADVISLDRGDRTKGIISTTMPLYRQFLSGLLLNQDITVDNLV